MTSLHRQAARLALVRERAASEKAGRVTFVIMRDGLPVQTFSDHTTAALWLARYHPNGGAALHTVGLDQESAYELAAGVNESPTPDRSTE